MFIGAKGLSCLWVMATGAGGYLTYNTINSSEKEWLSNSGYIFNPPKFTDYKSQDNSCLENLFKEDPDFDQNKVYGCRVARINIWNNEDKSSEHVTWADKLTIRKGDNGWQIITVIDSREGAVKYIQMTTYSKNGSGWYPKTVNIGASKLAQRDADANKQPTSTSCDEDDGQDSMSQENKYLQFKPYGDDWYKGTDNSSVSSDQAEDDDLPEVLKESKSGSWIFIEDDKNASSMQILSDFKLLNFDDKQMILLWMTGDCNQTYFSEDPKLKPEDYANIQNECSKIQAWSNKGKWTKTEEFCDLNDSRKRGLDKEHKKNLKLFCAKAQNNYWETN